MFGLLKALAAGNAAEFTNKQKASQDDTQYEEGYAWAAVSLLKLAGNSRCGTLHPELVDILMAHCQDETMFERGAARAVDDAMFLAGNKLALAEFQKDWEDACG